MRVMEVTSLPLPVPREGTESELSQLLDQKAYLEEMNRKLELVFYMCHVMSHDVT